MPGTIHWMNSHGFFDNTIDVRKFVEVGEIWHSVFDVSTFIPH